MKTAAIIEARMTSTRLPGKVMCLILGKPMLELLIERLKHADTLDEIIIATTTNKEDNIIGILYQKDIFIPLQKGAKKESIKNIARPVSFVLEGMKVNQALKFFKDKQLHMAIVLDEHGAIAGLVTLEDALEEIVGEIRDEHEGDSSKIISLEDGSWLATGNTTLDELQDLLGISFDAETAITLGGFLTEQLQHVPKKGERIEYRNFIFQIQKATARRILQVLIFNKK